MAGLIAGEQITQTLGDNVRSVQVEALAGGGYVVAYQGVEGGNGSVFVRVFDADGGLVAGPIDAAQGLGNPQSPVLAALSDGGFGLAYQFLTGPGSSDANAITFNADGSVRSGPITISTTGVVFDIPRFADDVSGGYVVQMQGAGPTITLFAELDLNGAPQTIVPSFIGNPGVDATTPNGVAGGANGVYALLYTDFENGDRQLRIQIREFGEGVVTDVTVAGETSGVIGALGDGFVVAASDGFIFINAAGQETGRTPFSDAGLVVTEMIRLSDGKLAVLSTDGAVDLVQIFSADGSVLSDPVVIPGLDQDSSTSRALATETSNGDLLFTRDNAGDGDQIVQIVVDPATLITAGGDDTGGGDDGGGDNGNDDGDGGDDTGGGDDGGDAATGTTGPDAFVGGAAADVFNGGGGNDTIAGGRGADTLSGGRGRDELSGGGGRDELSGGGGQDSLSGGGGRDLLNGNGGADTLEGDGGRDELNGGGGRDLIEGGGGRDVLNGGGGRDVLLGGRGSDELTGGGGRDTFRFTQGDGRDTITDFRQRTDRIEIEEGAGSFADLTIAQAGDDVLIRFANVRITVEDDEVANFTATDFIF